MTRRAFILRSLRFHARAHFGTVLGATIASATLIGALVVGDSVRETLRQTALQRLAGAWFAAAPTDRTFGQDILPASAPRGPSNPFRPGWIGYDVQPVPLLVLSASASLPSGAARANRIQVIGANEDFWKSWKFTNSARSEPLATRNQEIIAALRLNSNAVFLNEALARQLRASKGDEIILRVHRSSPLSLEAAITPRSRQDIGLRLTVAGVAPGELGGNLNLKSSGLPPFNAFVDPGMLSDRTDLAGQANVILTGRVWELQVAPPTWIGRIVGSNRWFAMHVIARWPRVLRLLYRHPQNPPADVLAAGLAALVKQHWTLRDAGLKLDYSPGKIELKSPRVFLDPAVVAVATNAAQAHYTPVLTYLANLVSRGTSSTPYSMVTAAGPPYAPPNMSDVEILLNEWLAEDLQAKPGDQVSLSYYAPESGAQLTEATNTFRVRGIVPMDEFYGDRTLMPDFPGIEGAESTRDWDAGFPLNYKIRPKDEDYWKKYRGTPKAFITLTAGQKMWANRFGSVTAIQFKIPEDVGVNDFRSNLEKRLLAALKPEDLGLRFEPVREQALKAADQGQDFGQLFLGFSLFLVIAALLLMALLFQFSLEQRGAEVGTLLALGFTPRQVRRMLLLEGTALALAGGLLGTLGGLAYAKSMLWGLNTVWRSAVGSAALQFHATLPTLLAGLFSAVLVATAVIWLALRKQARVPARQLLAADGNTTPWASHAARTWWNRSRAGTWVGVVCGLLAFGIAAWSLVSAENANAESFFSAGALLLVAGLGFVSAWLRRVAAETAAAKLTLARLSLRGCARRRNRSLATVALLSSGCFLIAAISVFRLDANLDATKRSSGTGGFALMGESTMPVVQDLNTEKGRDSFALSADDLKGVNFAALRVHEGDEASCLNLNRAQKPRLLGVNPELLSGRFTFTQVAKGLDRNQGWELLRGSAHEDEIPAIGDANSIEWALGKKVGDVLEYADERGRALKVRLVGAVANSILQGSLIIDEAAFLKRFPNGSGHRIFLIDAPPNSLKEVSATLSRALQDVGLEVTRTTDRLNAFNAVQNTYLGTFQILGGLGVLLGSAGLGVVVLRNVLERRSELGLLVASGFRRQLVSRMLLGEHAALLVAGLALGILAAAVAVLPALLSAGRQFPGSSLPLTLAAVSLNGALWTWLATRWALRGDLLAALRNE